MQDADVSVPFFWGTDSEGHLVLSDEAEIVKKGCGKSFAPFPKGICFNMLGKWLPSWSDYLGFFLLFLIIQMSKFLVLKYGG